jgi:malonyl-CoA/methylmalonyl-CoA synthetase
VVVPTNTAYRERELTHIVNDARPRAALVDNDERGNWVRLATESDLLVVGPEVDLPDHPAPTLDATPPDAPALIGYTSGTTGTPKGAVLTHANLLAGSKSVGLAWRWTAQDRLVLALPLYHAHGLCVGLHGTLLAGASAVLLPRFEVGAVLDAASALEASMFFGVPTMYHRLALSPRVDELARLRLCVSGSAPLPAELHQALAERGQQVLERYGMTETLMLVSNPYDGERRPGSVGFPLPGVELRFSDGHEGEIHVRGPTVFAGYWERPEATAESFIDGWFRTGDLGSIDSDGYIQIRGRSKELIISGGLNVYPREVEEVLLAHPDVAEAAVVGTPSHEWGEVVTAFVVPAGNHPDAEPLLDFASQQLAPYKCPRLVHFVDSLPRNALGKVLKHELGG